MCVCVCIYAIYQSHNRSFTEKPSDPSPHVPHLTLMKSYCLSSPQLQAVDGDQWHKVTEVNLT